jgi:uncharacterized cupin superfamily protein
MSIPRLGSLLAVAAALLVGAAIGAAFALSAVARSTAAAPIAHGRPADFNWEALPEFGGRQAIFYRSADGHRVAAAFEESGKESFTYPFDEFLMVTAGTVKVTVHGGETFQLSKGDVAYMPEGTAVDFEFSKDFADITNLTADHVVKWR